MERIELFSLNDRFQVGNNFCGCNSNHVPEMVVGNFLSIRFLLSFRMENTCAQM